MQNPIPVITELQRLGGAVDREKSLIKGVSLIKTGPTKGHDRDVDETTLSQIMALFPPTGLRGKINHRDPGGVLSTNGRHVNPRITHEADGMHIRTDWQLSPERSTTPELLSLAEDQPEDCGISVRCMSTKQIGPDRRAKMRVSSLLSADLVDVPAANESLLEARGTLTSVTELAALQSAQKLIDETRGLDRVFAAQRAAKQHGPEWKARLTQLSGEFLEGRVSAMESLTAPTDVGLRLCAVVDTAGKSLHGWFEYPPANVLAELKIVLPIMGCDPKMFSASQTCRLPGGLRDGRVQRLIYSAIGGAQ